MIQGFRKIFQSPIGLAAALIFLVLIALAFASADITGSSFGGIAGGERVATVGNQRISTSTYRETLNGAFQRAREANPTLTMEQFVEAGADDEVLDQMVERLALYAFAHENGIRMGDSLVGSELSQIPAFQGPDGKFSQEAYKAALQQRGVSEKLLRSDIEQGLAARMVLLPAQIGTAMPEKIARQYARLLNETRQGSVAFVPSTAFAGDVKVDDAGLKSFLAANRTRYSLPERRSIRYAVLEENAIGDIAATDAEIAARYDQDRQQYAGREERALTQLVLPTEAAAKAVLAELTDPAKMAATAADKGLSTTQVTAESRADLSGKTAPAVTQVVYDTAEGKIAGPVRGPLGWYLLRVDKVTKVGDRSLADVRNEIAGVLTAEKRREAMADLAAKAEQQLNGGASLAEVAKGLDLSITTTVPFQRDGTPYGSSTNPTNEVVRILPAVYAMDEDSDPQIAISADGQSYILFEPARITPAAPPPFAQIRPILDRDYRLQEGAKRAEAAADKVLAAIRKGKSPADAIRLVGKPVPPVDSVNLSRRELMGSGGQVPPALALMFTMGKGSNKKLEAPGNMGWLLVDLDEIESEPMSPDDPLVQATRAQLGPVTGGELGDQLSRAIRKDVGVSRNNTAIEAVIRQLTGER